MTFTLQRETICAVIVTYNPDGNLAARVERIAAQVDRVLIVDNHSGPAALATLRTVLQTSEARSRIQILWNEQNLGIATALNQGTRWVFEQGYSYALLFDQDTAVQENLVEVYAKIQGEVFAGGEIALIGANFFRSVDGQIARKIKPKTIPASSSGTWAEATTMLTSGTLLPRAVWERVGAFRDEFFIDGVDEEYCLRARARGVRVVTSTAPLMSHSIGDQSRYRFLWKLGWTHNYSPLRHYCRTRNAVSLWLTFFRREPRWVACHILFNTKILAKICLYEPQKGRKLRGLGLGLLDGLRGRFDLLAARVR